MVVSCVERAVGESREGLGEVRRAVMHAERVFSWLRVVSLRY